MVILDATIVNVALPSIQKDLLRERHVARIMAEASTAPATV
jgi:hypothetical protein